MTGIKITKPFTPTISRWPADWHRLARIIEPIGESLRAYWWAVGEVTWKVPVGWQFSELPPRPGSRQWRFEQAIVPRDGPTLVARPGFLPEFADVVSSDWSKLYGLRAEPSAALLGALAATDWFTPPSAFPPGVEVAIRSVDHAYWELFAQDPERIAAVHHHARDVAGLIVQLLPAE